MAEEYVNRYMRTSHLARLAKAEGWAGRLRGYVHAAAHVQAQFICGCTGIGWESAVLSPGGDGFDAFRETIRGPVTRGQIRITVPASRVREWKGGGPGEGASEEPPSPGPPCPDRHFPGKGLVRGDR